MIQQSAFFVAVATTALMLLGNSIDGFTVTTTISSSSIRTVGRRSTQLYSSATTSQDGLVKSIAVPGYGGPVRLGDIATVKYSCYLAADDDNKNTIPFARSTSQKVAVGDGTMIDGWDKALRSMSIGERSIIRITDPSLAYGTKGVPPYIPPNSIIEMDIEVLDSVPASMNIDFDSLAAKADKTPTTAKDIAAAFERRQQIKASQDTPELEGLDWWIAKIKNFYFYGLFEGETGERPPWFLRPSITFPLAFAIVGAAFYIALANGAITERGAQTKDELDEIILSSSTIPSVLPSGISLASLYTSAILVSSFILPQIPSP